MASRISLCALVACSLFCGTAAACAAQAYTPPPPPLTTLPPCPVDKDTKKRAKRKDCDPTVYPSETVATKAPKTSEAGPATPAQDSAPKATDAAQQFPFPGDKAAQPADVPAAKAFPYPGETTPDVPHDPAAAAKAADTPAGKAFPFPGEATPDMPSDSIDPPKPEAATSSSSSSGPSSSSDNAGDTSTSRSSASRNPDDDDDSTDTPKLKDEGSAGSTAKGRRGKKAPKPQTDTERVDEDLTVARFYGQSGNAMGAYLRAKDAVKTQPDYAEAHFVLGEAARRLNKRDEAVAEFTTYLKLAPDGDKAKASEKALEDIK